MTVRKYGMPCCHALIMPDSKHSMPCCHALSVRGLLCHGHCTTYHTHTTHTPPAQPPT